MAPTLEDIAKKAGCSSATVSRVLNNTGQVSDDMRQNIMKVVEDINYRPRKSEAMGLRVGRQGSRLVRIVVCFNCTMERMSLDKGRLRIEKDDDYSSADIVAESNRLSNSFYRTVVDGMIDELECWGYRAVLMPCRNLLAPEFIDEIRQDDCAGILLTGAYTNAPDIAEFISACNSPLMVVDLDSEKTGGNPVVTIDNFAGVGMAFDHLYSLGHRNIGFLLGVEDNFAYNERETAYRYNMAAKGLEVREEWIYRGHNMVETSAEWLGKRLGDPGRPSAFLSSSDVLALGAVRAADAVGVSIPDELSVVGFDDIEPAAAVTPPLTTVHAPTREMGALAVQQLMIAAQATSGKTLSYKLRVMPELVVRSSTAVASG
ncbi:MAG: LacI family DNA-binding transcriptional regulator [Planctomycetes bacterium]|nr:LacI family DNA-binding transcriptional regulator [Planctomycetota bacterium]